MPEKPHISLYWKCQLAGWSAASVYWNLQAFLEGNYIVWVGAIQFLSDVALYIFITHLYHRFALRHRWQMLELRPLIVRLIPSLIVLAVLYLAVTSGKIYLFRRWLTHDHAGTIIALLQTGGLPIFMAGIRLMAIWLLAHHLYYYGKREITLARDNARLTLAAKDAEMRLALFNKDAQMNSLQTQLNPHFLFNALNTIKALVVDDPSLARRGIDLMSELLRSSLYNDGSTTQSIQEEIDLVTDYLELEKLRLEDRLQTAITFPTELVEVPILRYSIQVLVENAVKHGISRQRLGGLLRISISEDHDWIKISVENPGTLAMTTSTSGLGLKNLKERLHLYYQGKADLQIGEHDGTVTASILIPKI